MPRQLLKHSHPATNIKFPPNLSEQTVLPTVKGLRWGVYTGSPQLPEPIVVSVYQVNFSRLISLDQTNVIYGIPECSNVMQGTEPDTMNIVSWGDPDDIVRIKPLCDTTSIQSKTLVNISRIDPVTASGTNTYSKQLWFGHRSGRITVYECKNSLNLMKMNKSRSISTKLSYNSAIRKVSGKLHLTKPTDMDDLNGNNLTNMRWTDPNYLIFHTNEVTDIKISIDFKIVVSVARDGLTAIWNLNKLQFIRSIASPSSLITPEIYLVEISSTLGDIVTVHSINTNNNDQLLGNASDDNGNDVHQQETVAAGEEVKEEESFEVTESNIDDFVKISMNLNGKTLLRLNTINGKYVNHVVLHEKVLSICYSGIKEGTGVNAIVTGFEAGVVRFWSSWDLSFIREIIVGQADVIRWVFFD